MSPSKGDLKSQIDLLCQNTVDVIDREDLFLRLENSAKENKPLRVKAGFDPSAPDIHLGHAVLLRKLRQFQDLGHKVVFIVGDFTAMIGDPTGQTKTRPALSDSEVEKNAKTYQEQAFKILDKDPKKIDIVRNSSWFVEGQGNKFSFKYFIEMIAARFTVAQILERNDFEARMTQNQPISIREFLYPLFQAYDSVVVQADVEIGGTDQKFNLLAGRDLQRAFGIHRPQIVMTMPLLVGLDGEKKMSKSLGNYIAINDSPKDVFGKAMSIPDALMLPYYKLLTNMESEEIQEHIVGTADHAPLHPRDAKVKLARLLTEFLHDQRAAEREEDEFIRVFSKKENPDHPEELKITEKEIWIVELLKKIGAASSTSEARRLIEQGAVSIDGDKISDFDLKVPAGKGHLIKAGKKKFVKVI